MGAAGAPAYDCVSSVVLISELLLPTGFLRNGVKAAPGLGLGARGAAHWSTFTQVAGECSVVDLLEVLLDFAPCMLQ